MERVDFFVKEERSIVMNEIKNIKGLKDMRMYLKVMDVRGVRYNEIINRLVENGLERGR